MILAFVTTAGVGNSTPAVELLQFPFPRHYIALRASAPLNIDGRLDDAAWRDAPWTDLFVDIDGDRKPAPRFETRVKMLWDDANLYIAAQLQEPHVWATLTEHDAVIFKDPDFEVFIDPNGDNHEYYEFEINARNTFWDLLLPRPYKDDGKPVNSWEIPGLKSAVSIDGTLNDPRDTDRGWSVELAFPWKVLGEVARRTTPPGDGDQWRINFSRVEWPIDTTGGAYRKPAGAREDNWVWSPQGVVDMHRPETWGYVQFTRQPMDKTTFTPDPSWAAREWLHRVYYAQREYLKAHGRYATTLQELGVTAPASPDVLNGTMRVAGRTFEAAAQFPGKGGPTPIAIRQDSLITVGVR